MLGYYSLYWYRLQRYFCILESSNLNRNLNKWMISTMLGGKTKTKWFLKKVISIKNWGKYSQVFLLRQLWTVNYYVKSLSNNLSNKDINTEVNWCFQRNDISKKVHFDILVHILSWRKHFHFRDYLTNCWRNNWRSIIDLVERLCLCVSFLKYITSDAIKIEPKVVVKHFCAWFDFYCIRR